MMGWKRGDGWWGSGIATPEFFFLWLLSSKYFTWLHFSQSLQPMALVGFSGFRLDLVYPPLPPSLPLGLPLRSTPSCSHRHRHGLCKKFFINVGFRYFFTLWNFSPACVTDSTPVPPTLFCCSLSLPSLPVASAFFRPFAFTFCVRLRWQRNFGVPGYVNFCATRSAMKAATNNKLRYSDKHFNNNNNSSSMRIHSGGISPCPRDANFYNIGQRKLFSCHFAAIEMSLAKH